MNDVRMIVEIWYGDDMNLWAKSGDQRSSKKENMKRDKTYEIRMFWDEHETENEKEQGVNGEEGVGLYENLGFAFFCN